MAGSGSGAAGAVLSFFGGDGWLGWVMCGPERAGFPTLTHAGMGLHAPLRAEGELLPCAMR
eukprot:962333-Prymnesium_polylepis.1